MRDYYFRHARWSQGLLLSVVVMSSVAQRFVDGSGAFSRQDAVRCLIAVVLLPGVISRAPALHAAQAILLLVVVALGVSYVSTPIG
jgi:hypothetical protein